MYAKKSTVVIKCETSFPPGNNQAHLREKSLRFFRCACEFDTGQSGPVLTDES